MLRRAWLNSSRVVLPVALASTLALLMPPWADAAGSSYAGKASKSSPSNDSPLVESESSTPVKAGAKTDSAPYKESKPTESKSSKQDTFKQGDIQGPEGMENDPSAATPRKAGASADATGGGAKSGGAYAPSSPKQDTSPGVTGPAEGTEAFNGGSTIQGTSRNGTRGGAGTGTSRQTGEPGSLSLDGTGPAVGAGSREGSVTSGAPDSKGGPFDVTGTHGVDGGLQLKSRTGQGPSDRGFDVSKGEKGVDSSFNSGAPEGDSKVTGTHGVDGGIQMKPGGNPSDQGYDVPQGDQKSGIESTTSGGGMGRDTGSSGIEVIGDGASPGGDPGTIIETPGGGGPGEGTPGMGSILNGPDGYGGTETGGAPGGEADTPFADSLPGGDAPMPEGWGANGFEGQTGSAPSGQDSEGKDTGYESDYSNNDQPQDAPDVDDTDTSDDSNGGGDDDPDMPNPEDPYGDDGNPWSRDVKSTKANAGGGVNDAKAAKTIKEYQPADSSMRGTKVGGRNANPYTVKEYTPADTSRGGLNSKAGGRANAFEAKSYQPDDTQRGGNLRGASNKTNAINAKTYQPDDTARGAALRNAGGRGINGNVNALDAKGFRPSDLPTGARNMNAPGGASAPRNINASPAPVNRNFGSAPAVTAPTGVTAPSGSLQVAPGALNAAPRNMTRSAPATRN